MSTTLRPDNVKAALDAKIAAAMAQLGELRESEQARITPHLNPREIVRGFLLYARGVHSIASAFGRAQAGELQFDAWYEQWVNALSDADRLLWRQLHQDSSSELIDAEIAVEQDSESAPKAASRPRAQKRVVRFAAYPGRPASAVGYDYLQLSRRFEADFVREHARFIK
jgi:hypothetical protein